VGEIKKKKPTINLLAIGKTKAATKKAPKA